MRAVAGAAAEDAAVAARAAASRAEPRQHSSAHGGHSAHAPLGSNTFEAATKPVPTGVVLVTVHSVAGSVSTVSAPPAQVLPSWTAGPPAVDAVAPAWVEEVWLAGGVGAVQVAPA